MSLLAVNPPLAHVYETLSSDSRNCQTLLVPQQSWGFTICNYGNQDIEIPENGSSIADFIEAEFYSHRFGKCLESRYPDIWTQGNTGLGLQD
jgi:hypothetical protein